MNITTIDIEPKKSTEELFEQLKVDVKEKYFKFTGQHISTLHHVLITQEVIQNSAFLDGFYFEGDILVAIVKVLHQ